MHIAIASEAVGRVTLVDADADVAADGVLAEADEGELPALVRRFETHEPRWVWADTRWWYPTLLAAGVRVGRCHDLRLCGAILASSTSTAPARGGSDDRAEWLPPGPTESAPMPTPTTASRAPTHTALFELDRVEPDDDEARRGAGTRSSSQAPSERRVGSTEIVGELQRQRALVAASDAPDRLRLLLAAESAGALTAAELRSTGLPWDRAVHERVLESELGPKPAPGRRPARMEALADEVRLSLGAPSVNLDSPTDLLKALRSAGIQVDTTSRWALREHEHAAIEPLIAYKKLARLYTANGWSWLDEWVINGRFRPEYVPGGTATGRWATSGGGALQLPKTVRAAVVADPGWRLVVADAAQLEPRVLAAMAADEGLSSVARDGDVYRGIVDARVVETREQAKVAVLGAMYGATTGDSGRLVPRLARAFPRAMAMVDAAARVGEGGGVVTTLLGRSSPRPPPEWRAIQSKATEADATPADERRARASAKDWGRFTRNFVVQGTAAEWALCWMAGLRAALDVLSERAIGDGTPLPESPHLVYYLHDELIVHTPAPLADEVADAVRASARDAGRLLFGDFPIDFPLDVAVVDSYADVGG